MSKLRSRRQYDVEFKKDAIRLSDEPGKTVRQVAEGLGLQEATLYRWRKEAKDKQDLAFPGNGKEALTEDQKKIRDLENQLRDVQMERDILKKAVGIFSKIPK